MIDPGDGREKWDALCRIHQDLPGPGDTATVEEFEFVRTHEHGLYTVYRKGSGEPVTTVRVTACRDPISIIESVRSARRLVEDDPYDDADDDQDRDVRGFQ